MRPVATLTAAQAQVFDLLTQVEAIGRHRGTFSRADMVRAAFRHFGGDALRKAEHRQRARADAAETAAAHLRARVIELENELATRQARDLFADDLPPRRIVELVRSQYEVFAQFCEGLNRQEIAEELGLAPGTVSNTIHHVADLIHADAPRAAAMVNRGIVVLRARPKGRGIRRVV